MVASRSNEPGGCVAYAFAAGVRISCLLRHSTCGGWLFSGWLGRWSFDPLFVTASHLKRAKPGRREPVELFEVTDEMAVVAHSDVVDDFLDRKARRLRELPGFRHP